MDIHTKLSEADRMVMEVLWEEGELSNADVVERLADEKNWSRHTVRTYLLRLVEKGLVGISEKSEKKHTYYPLVSKEAFLSSETNTFLRENFNGLKYMIAGLVSGNYLDDKELDDLEQYIKDFKEKGK